jgi:uncharacterized phiE125 gp8 family phage protein
MRVQERDGIAEGALPLEEFAARLRLPDGWDAVTGQRARLAGQLRAAIESVEGRTGKVLLARRVVVAGRGTGAPEVVLPVAPVGAVTGVEEDVGGAWTTVDATGARIVADLHAPRLVLPVVPPAGRALRLELTAGWADWAAVPAALRAAVLTLAEAMERADLGGVMAEVRALTGGWRRVRLGVAR